MKKILYSFLLLFCLFDATAQAPTDVDQTFGAYSGFNGTVIKVLVQADGKVLVGGSFTQYKGRDCNYLVRLLPDGSIDPDFNTGTGFNNIITEIAVQSDGKILVGGNFQSFNSNSANKFIRLNSDGSKDTTFNIGIGQGSSSSYGDIYCFALQPDNKIIIGGNFNSFGPWPCKKIGRLNPDGSVDTSFATGGGFNEWVNDIALQPDGKIVVVGRFTYYNGYTRNGIIRLNPDATVDTTFSIGIGFTSLYSETFAEVKKAFVQADGKIIVCGGFSNYKNQPEGQLIRLLPDGSKDTSFNSGTGFTNSTIYDAAIGSDGKLSIVGGIGNYNGEAVGRSGIRINADGTRDATFIQRHRGTPYSLSLQSDGKVFIAGANGCFARLQSSGQVDTTFNYGEGFYPGLSSCLLLPDGKMIVGGFASYNFTSETGIIRLNADGTKDPTFATDLVDVGGEILLRQPDGKILAYGYHKFDNGSGTTILYGLVRLHPDGTRDTSFNAAFYSSQVHVIALQPDGKILVSGYNLGIQPSAIHGLIRLNADGSLDNAFPPFTGFGQAYLSAILPLPDGKILVSGNFTQVSGEQHLHIARLMPNGSIDPSFVSGEGFNYAPWAFHLLPDGKILAAGGFSTYNMMSAVGLARLHPDGTLDQTFNTGLSQANFRCLAVAPDGKIVAGGLEYWSTKNLMRFGPNGEVDTSFDIGDGFTYQPNSNANIKSLQLLPDGKILVHGQFYLYNGIASTQLIRLAGGNNLSTDELDDSAIVIYPNPVRSLLYVNSTDAIHPVSYGIYDLTGKKLLNGSDFQTAINVESLAEGIYLLKMQGQDAKEYVCRFIKD